MTVFASQPSVSIDTETTQADGATELSVLAHGVHDLTQQLLIADIFSCTGIPGALDSLAAEACNLIGRHAAKLVVEGGADFQLLTVNQQRVRTRERIPRGFVKIAEEGQATVFQCGGPVFVLSVKAGNEIIDQLRDRGVLAHDDEAGWHTNAPCLPQHEGLLVVPVERLKSGLQSGG